MELYLFRNGERVGPFSEDRVVSMVSSGEIGRDALVWHEGLADWQPVHTVIESDAPGDAAARPPLSPVPAGAIGTNPKWGLVIGGWACLVLGLVCMVGTLWLFFVYGPLYLAAFILAIMAMTQRRVLAGVVLLAATILVPSGFAMVLVTTRVVDFAENVTESVGEFVREANLDALEELRERKARHEQRLAALASFEVLEASYSREETGAGTREAVVLLKVHNATEYPVKRAYFRGVLASPGRAIPWVDEEFSHEIAGGVEPGETVSWRLAAQTLGEWGDIDAPAGAQFTVTVLKLDGADGRELFGGADFTEADRERLEFLEREYGGEALPAGEEGSSSR